VTELDEAADEILQRAIAGEDLGRLLARAARALCTAGLPVLRCSIAIPTLDPTVRGHNWIWRRRDCVAESDQATLETLPHDDAGESADQRTAIGVMLERQVFMHSWRLDRGGADIAVIPLLADLRAQGMTEFAMRLVPFAEGGALLGCAFSMATDRACGFSAADVAAPRRLGPTLALAAYRHGLAQNAASALQVYLGAATGPRVLAGAIRRGDGELIRAAILLADLRGFTALSGRAAPSDVVRWLNEYFDAIGGPIVERGGEILKFLGDGLLAVFPAAAEQSAQDAACAVALAAAEDALARVAAVNAGRGAAGPALPLDIALHVGEVFYGNIGTARRLDFTVIGSAVNEASRMEKVCDRVGRHLVLSAGVAAGCAASGRAVASIGRHVLAGVGEREIFEPLGGAGPAMTAEGSER
jgi:adenylate cyclase